MAFITVDLPAPFEPMRPTTSPARTSRSTPSTTVNAPKRTRRSRTATAMVIGDVLADVVPDPLEVVGRGTVLVDGTVCPTWDWRHVPDLFSAKTGYPGMNLQIAATLDGELAAVGPVPVHGARHDAYAFAASGLAEVLTDYPTVADLGYVGVEGIDTVPYKRFPGIDLNTGQVEFNTSLSKIRAAVEHAIAHLKTWRMLSEEGGRYRAPLEKYPSMLKAVIGLFFFAAYE